MQFEHNTTGINYGDRSHLHSHLPGIIDFHSHVAMCSPEEKPDGPVGGAGEAGSVHAAKLMLEQANAFGIEQTITMCPPQDIAPLRQHFGKQLRFNAMVIKRAEQTDADALNVFEAFLTAGVEIVKLWAAPRGRDRGLLLDQPWRREILTRARNAGIKLVMVHVGDPDVWWKKQYLDTAKYGTKPEQYEPLYRLIDDFPEFQWIGAHMGGNPEHPDQLAAMLDRFPQLHFDTSATKWIVREVSQHPQAIRDLVEAYPTRFLFGTDLVTRHHLPEEHYISRYWCQRSLWESTWQGESPIADPDFTATPEKPSLLLRGVGLSLPTLRQVYRENALRLLESR